MLINEFKRLMDSTVDIDNNDEPIIIKMKMIHLNENKS